MVKYKKCGTCKGIGKIRIDWMCISCESSVDVDIGIPEVNLPYTSKMRQHAIKNRNMGIA